MARSTLSPAGELLVAGWGRGGQLTQLQQGDVVFRGAKVEVIVDQHFANSYFRPKMAEVQGYSTQY